MAEIAAPAKLEADYSKSGDPDSDLPPNRLQSIKSFLWRHLKFLGPGLILSTAYCDPGNYSTGLESGANYGYALLFIVLTSGVTAMLLQILALRLGLVSGQDLAQICRTRLHNRPKHTMLWRWGLLYPLYFLAEASIIFTDLAELLGSAIAINLLFPVIPLYAGTLLTALDVFVVLLVFDSYPSKTRNRSVQAFEILIGALVLTVLASFIVLMAKLNPHWGHVFRGYLPSKETVTHGALYSSVGIIGATVMPHALYLGSKLATIDRLQPLGASLDSVESLHKETEEVPTSPRMSAVRDQGHGRTPSISLHLPQPRRIPSTNLFDTNHRLHLSLDSLKTHIKHGSLDIGISLACFALVINSAILICSSAAFYRADRFEAGQLAEVQSGDLFTAFDLIHQRLGKALACLFALTLLLSGQAASITATLAGQIVGEGFLNWRTKPWIRRLITRCIGLIPSLVVATTLGRDGLSALLVASQVALSVILPFVIFPLLWFTNDKNVMSIPDDASTNETYSIEAKPSILARCNPFAKTRRIREDSECFANNDFIKWLTWFIFIVVVAADVYAFVELGQGNA